MKYLRDVIVRKRPLPAPQTRPDAAEPEPVSDFFDLDAVRARLQDLEGATTPAPTPAGQPEERAPAPDAAREAAPSATASAGPAGTAAGREGPVAKTQIWDIDDAGRDEDSTTPPQRPQRRPQPGLFSGASGGASGGDAVEARGRPGPDRDAARAPAPSAPSAAARVKTRIIGFHSGSAESDVFGARQAAPSAVAQFPAGWLVVVDGPGRGASFAIGAGVSTIGRGADQTVCLDFGDTSVSRENHASVAYDDEQNRFFVGHGGKSNIVRRNGNPVLATEELTHADLIRIGKTTLRFVALCGPDFTWGPTDERQDGDAAQG